MTRLSALTLAGVLLIGALPAVAADKDVRTCSLTRVVQCVPDERCDDYTVQDVALPRFVRIDLNAKTMESLDKDVQRNSKITSVERREGLIIMHGTEVRGWTMTISEDSGDLALSAAGDGEGFIVFGSCITR